MLHISCMILEILQIPTLINASLVTADSNFLFRDTRASVLEQSLRKLGVEKLSKEDVQKMQWEVLEAKIGNWIHFMRIAVIIYLIQYFDSVRWLVHNCFPNANRLNYFLLVREKFVIRCLKALIP